MKDLTYLKLTDEDIGKIMRRAREDAIEECAQVIEQWDRRQDEYMLLAIAAAIRARIRDKP